MDRANLKRDPKNQEALVNWWLFGTFTCTYHHISIFMYACCMCLFIHYANVHLEMMPCTVGSAPRPLRGLMKTGPMVEMFKTGSFQINSGASDQQVLNRSMVLPQCQSMVVGYNPKWFPSHEYLIGDLIVLPHQLCHVYPSTNMLLSTIPELPGPC